MLDKMDVASGGSVTRISFQTQPPFGEEEFTKRLPGGLAVQHQHTHAYTRGAHAPTIKNISKQPTLHNQHPPTPSFLSLLNPLTTHPQCPYSTRAGVDWRYLQVRPCCPWVGPTRRSWVRSFEPRRAIAHVGKKNPTVGGNLTGSSLTKRSAERALHPTIRPCVRSSTRAREGRNFAATIGEHRRCVRR